MGGILLPIFGILASQTILVDPRTIPNLNLWYNGSASTTSLSGVSTNNFDVTVSNGTRISSWKDLSGTGHDNNVNGGNSRRPQYITPIQNGHGAVFYTASNSENLDINPIGWMGTLPGFTIFVASRPTSTPATAFPLTVTDTSTGIWWNGTNWSVGVTAGNRGTVSLTNDTSKFHIYGMIYDGSQTGNANRLKLRYNQAEQTLSFTGTIPATTGSPAYFYFGGNNRSGAAGGALASTFMDGYIGEIMIWTRTLNNNEILSVEEYLATKWGL